MPYQHLVAFDYVITDHYSELNCAYSFSLSPSVVLVTNGDQVTIYFTLCAAHIQIVNPFVVMFV